jgi:L-asparaginase
MPHLIMMVQNHHEYGTIIDGLGRICMVKKIGIVFTGGTIGSTVGTDGFVAGDSAAPRRLLQMYGRLYGNALSGHAVEFITQEPYSILSERLSAGELVLLAQAVSGMLGRGVDGVIVTHGTDTLAYSAAFLDLVLGECDVPVLLVSSDYPLEDERANGLCNFHAAVDFICQSVGRGVFVSYRDRGACHVKLHRGQQLLAQEAYTDSVHSIDDCCHARYFDGSFEVTDDGRDVIRARVGGLSQEALEQGARDIVRVRCYPQMNYPRIDREMCVLMETYHSGTMYVGESFCEFANEVGAFGGTIYVAGVDGSRNQYETTKAYDREMIEVLPRMSPVAAYCLLWLGRSGLVLDVNVQLGGCWRA